MLYAVKVRGGRLYDVIIQVKGIEKITDDKRRFIFNEVIDNYLVLKGVMHPGSSAVCDERLSLSFDPVVVAFED